MSSKCNEEIEVRIHHNSFSLLRCIGTSAQMVGERKHILTEIFKLLNAQQNAKDN